MAALKILVAPSGFKESLDAEAVAAAIAEGIHRASPEAEVIQMPLVDGGEGFSATLARVTDGEVCKTRVTGPIGEPVDAHFALLGGAEPRTAALELAAAAGLRLVPKEQRDPLATTTYGVGELIKAALDAGAQRILIGCGDSGTSDGGSGMAQALGVKLLKADGAEIGRGGAALAELERIDVSGRDARLDKVEIDVACNIHNVLCGENGVARIFGPQKGASPETVEQMAAALDRYADVIERDLKLDVRELPGGGASGGTGAGLTALLGATLHQRYEIVMQYLDVDAAFARADLIFTAEGGIDFQTPRGKIPAEVGHRAKRCNVPVIALAGTIGRGAEINYEHGIDAMFSILDHPSTLDEAIHDARALLVECAENVMRAFTLGIKLGGLGGHARAASDSTQPRRAKGEQA